MKVKLTQVLGDQEEFADLIGKIGELSINEKSIHFRPIGSQWLVMARKRLQQKDGVVRVTTTLGNRFTFKDLDYIVKKS